MLWIALELPAFPLQIVERAGVSSEPLVISEGSTQRPTVACANAAAKQAGIREGQAVAAAKALARELRIRPRDEAVEVANLERIAAWAAQFTSMVCTERQGVVLEVESCLKLFKGHAALTACVRRGIHELGFHAMLGIAPTPMAARLIARAEAHGIQVRSCLALEELRARIADLPLFLLEWPGQSLARLTDLGILRLKDLLELPTDGLARRFGPEAVLCIDRILGRAPDPRKPYQPPARFRSRLELPAEAESVEALLFPLRRLLVECEGALRARGSGVQHLALTLEQGRKSFTRLELDFASPERESEFILSIAREKLGRLELAKPAIGLELRADTLLPYVPRSQTWLPGAQEQAIDRERLIERLAARLGRERVFGIAVADDHRPERGVMPVEPGKALRSRKLVEGSRYGPRPVWLLQRAQRLVLANGLPVLQGPLDLRAGPERIEAGWWDGNEVRRDYYVAANANGETYWIFREHRDPNAWYLHGVFA